MIELGSLQPSEVIEVPARIGLVADTHRWSGRRLGLPEQLLRGLDGCELILHAGDFNAMWVYDELAEIAPVFGVHGNNDEADVVKQMPLQRFFTAGTYRLGLVHGHVPGRTARQSALEAMGGTVDCVVYGHSHIPDVSREDGLLLVNPGSPTQKRWGPDHCYAIMTIEEEIEVDVIRLP